MEPQSTLSSCIEKLLPFGTVTAILATFFILRDKLFSPVKPMFQVDSVAVSPCPVSASPGSDELIATWDVKLVAINNNRKLDFFCQSLRASLFYLDKKHTYNNLLSTRQLHPFYLTKMNQITFNVTISTEGVYVGSDEANDFMMSSSSSEGSGCHEPKGFWLKLKGDFGYNTTWWSWWTLLGVPKGSRFSCGLSTPNNQSRACITTHGRNYML